MDAYCRALYSMHSLNIYLFSCYFLFLLDTYICNSIIYLSLPCSSMWPGDWALASRIMCTISRPGSWKLPIRSSSYTIHSPAGWQKDNPGAVLEARWLKQQSHEVKENQALTFSLGEEPPNQKHLQWLVVWTRNKLHYVNPYITVGCSTLNSK